MLGRTGWSQRELSRRAGIADTHVGTILRKLAIDPNYSVETKTLRKLAEAAGVSVSWLLTGEGEPEATLATVDRDEDPEDLGADPGELPETLGQRKNYAQQEKRARAVLTREGVAVPETLWAQIRATNNFITANSPPPVALLVGLAKALLDGGEPDLDPARVVRPRSPEIEAKKTPELPTGKGRGR